MSNPQLVPQRIIEWSVDVPRKYEIVVHDDRVEVTLWIFRSWAGQRFLDGEAFHGPVYFLGTDEVSKWT